MNKFLIIGEYTFNMEKFTLAMTTDDGQLLVYFDNLPAPAILKGDDAERFQRFLVASADSI